MDILVTLKGIIDSSLLGLDPRVSGILARLTLLNVYIATALYLSPLIWRPTTPFVQTILVLCGTILAFATQTWWISSISHDYITWSIITYLLIMFFVPHFIAAKLSPNRRTRACIVRGTYVLSVTLTVVQLLTVVIIP